MCASTDFEETVQVEAACIRTMFDHARWLTGTIYQAKTRGIDKAALDNVQWKDLQVTLRRPFPRAMQPPETPSDNTGLPARQKMRHVK